MKNKIKKKNQPLLPAIWIGLVVHTCNPSIRKLRQKDLCESETRQEYTGRPCFKKQKQTNSGLERRLSSEHWLLLLVLSPNLSTQMAAHNHPYSPGSRGVDALFWPPLALQCTHTQIKRV